MPELQQQNSFQKRQVAYKVTILDVLSGIFMKDDTSAGYIKLNNANISRINIIATVVYKSEDSGMIIDDGTGKISLRSFENTSFFSKVDIGDAVLIIGRIREFNNEMYILPEILKKINNFEWVNVRKLELRNNHAVGNGVKEKEDDLAEEAAINADGGIYLLIKKLDYGDGASIEDVIKNSDNSNVEKIIYKLLEKGDIFEIKPGRLKVLE